MQSLNDEQVEELDRGGRHFETYLAIASVEHENGQWAKESLGSKMRVPTPATANPSEYKATLATHWF